MNQGLWIEAKVAREGNPWWITLMFHMTIKASLWEICPRSLKNVSEQAFWTCIRDWKDFGTGSSC